MIKASRKRFYHRIDPKRQNPRDTAPSRTAQFKKLFCEKASVEFTLGGQWLDAAGNT